MAQTSMKIDVDDLALLDKRRGEVSRPNFLKELLSSEGSIIETFPLDQILPNPYQVRSIALEDVAELAIDIYTNGLLQVPIGRKTPDGAQSAFGHRRVAAFRFIVAQGRDNEDEAFANWQQFTSMPLVIKPLTDMEMYNYMAAENGQREDPNIIEIARSIQLGKEQFNLSQRAAGNAHGINSDGQISDIVALLTLPLPVQTLIEGGAFGIRKNGGQLKGRQLVRMVSEGVDAAIVEQVAKDTIKMEYTVSVLKTRVDHEINTHKRKTTMHPRYCPQCNEINQVSSYDLDENSKQYWKCTACGDNGHRLGLWLSPEGQANKERLSELAEAAKSSGSSGGGGGGSSGGSSSGGETATWLANRQTQLEALQAQTTPCPHCGEPMLDECKKCGQTSFIKPEPTAIPTPTAETTPAEPTPEPATAPEPTVDAVVDASPVPEPTAPPPAPNSEKAELLEKVRKVLVEVYLPQSMADKIIKKLSQIL